MEVHYFTSLTDHTLYNSSSGKSVQHSTSIDEYINNYYTIQNCFFCNNHASSLKHTGIYIHSNDVFHGFGRGGGLAIYLDGDMKQSRVKIMMCIFHSNSAYLGGGLFVMFRGDLSNNSVTVEDSEFITNHAKAFTPLSDDNNNIKRTKIQKLLQKKGGGGGGAGGIIIKREMCPGSVIETSLSSLKIIVPLLALGMYCM